MQHRLYGTEQRESAAVQQFEAQMHASQHLTGVRESELAESVNRQDMQMQRMMGEEVQATMAFAATQRELQRMADEESHAAVRVGIFSMKQLGRLACLESRHARYISCTSRNVPQLSICKNLSLIHI